jgi:hypothetical protein
VRDLAEGCFLARQRDIELIGGKPAAAIIRFNDPW